MRSAHDERRAAEILSVHRPVRMRGRGRVCSCCGQSWPCTDYSWAALTEEPGDWTWREAFRVAAYAVGGAIIAPAVICRLVLHLLPDWAWTAVIISMPVAILGIVIAASRRVP